MASFWCIFFVRSGKHVNSCMHYSSMGLINVLRIVRAFQNLVLLFDVKCLLMINVVFAAFLNITCSFLVKFGPFIYRASPDISFLLFSDFFLVFFLVLFFVSCHKRAFGRVKVLVVQMCVFIGQFKHSFWGFWGFGHYNDCHLRILVFWLRSFFLQL